MFKYISIMFFIWSSVYASTYKKISFEEDNAQNRVLKERDKNSHIKVFLPTIPYSYVAKNTNAGLLRSYDNKKGWILDLAKSYKRVDDYTYIFEIRDNLRFQDGSKFTVDSVIRNFEFFKKYPILYTNIDNIDFDVFKLSQKKIKIVLKQKYEMFLLDLARIYFYTDTYLDNYKPKGEQTGSATKIPGPFGMGPYILKSGYAVGTKQTAKLQLQANPYYWNKKYPKIEKITVYTQLNMKEALADIINYEGKLDITPIAFNKKIDVLMSKYAKLIIKESTNNIVIYFNMLNGNKKLQNKKVRIALNEAINQSNLLNFVYKKEGEISPFTASINYDIVKNIAKKNEYKKFKMDKIEKLNLLNGLTLNVLTQDRFKALWKGIEFQLKRYGVKLNYIFTTSEKDIYEQLFNTRKNTNTVSWDMLTWGDDDWYYQNPWSVFFVYEQNSPWSTMPYDGLLDKYIKELFITKIDSPAYEEVVSKILYRARNEAYTLRVPSPNKILAVNKEVVFTPYAGGIIPLWEIEVTKDHWSVRKQNTHPESFDKHIKPQREKNEFK